MVAYLVAQKGDYLAANSVALMEHAWVDGMAVAKAISMVALLVTSTVAAMAVLMVAYLVVY
jgi:hypothetical protein